MPETPHAPELHDHPAGGLLPTPRQLDVGEGTLSLPAVVRVSGDAERVRLVRELLRVGTGLDLVPGEDGHIVVAGLDAEPGAYTLVIDDAVRIGAADAEGLANAVATLRQLLPDWTHGPAPLPGAGLELPRLSIQDAPAFGWRGMHLDVARHFAPLPFLYRFVDLLHAHKFNVFHLHLTDDQGWRFEVKRWPRLTTHGASRPGTRFPDWDEHDGVPHGGFYTQDQLRALVGYAKQRGITIVPEVDVPGHVRSVLAAYPELGDGETSVATGFGIFNEVLHLDQRAVGFIEDVFGELLEVFDSPVVHIGGDECLRDQWRANPDAAKLADERGVESVEQLQPWLTRHLRDFLHARGRRMIGWDEILDDGEVPQDAVVMSWRGSEPGRKALAAGHDVVMAPNIPLYFDYYQSGSGAERRAIGGHNPWQAVAAYDPADGVPASRRDHLLGIQGQLWTEYITDTAHLEYMAFPRAAVLAEVAWGGAPVAPSELEPRLRRHLRRLDAADVNHRPLDGPHPWQEGGTGRYRRLADDG